MGDSSPGFSVAQFVPIATGCADPAFLIADCQKLAFQKIKLLSS